MNGDDGAGRFNGTQNTVIILLVGETDELGIVAQELGHDVSLTGNGSLDLIIGHLEEIPGWLCSQPDKMALRSDALNGFLDVRVGEVLGGKMECGLDLLVAQVIQELTGVIGGSVVEGECHHTVRLAAINDGSLGS